MPEFDAINPLTAVIKPIGSVNRLALMVTAQKEKVFRVFNLECQQQADRSYRKMTPVHIVSQEQVIGVWRIASAVEMVKQVFKLAVDVS